MREQLLGYLLELLEPRERAEVESKLRTDPEWRAELEKLQVLLHPLHFDVPVFEPPTTLADKTCDFVFAAGSAPGAGVADVASSAAGWRWQDLGVLSLVAVGILAILFPALSLARFQSQLFACQNNLHQVGHAMINYSRHHQGDFPFVDRGDRLSGAVFCGSVLLDEGFLESPHALLCPTSRAASQSAFAVPKLAQLRSASHEQMTTLERQASGSYAHHVGYELNGNYLPPKNFDRDNFPIVADAPSLHLDNFQSVNHAGAGQNILCEAGNVVFCPTTKFSPTEEDVFRNREGYIGPGSTLYDSVIVDGTTVSLIAASRGNKSPLVIEKR